MAKVKRHGGALQSKARFGQSVTQHVKVTSTVKGAKNFYDYKILGELNGCPEGGWQLEFAENSLKTGRG